MQLKEQWIREGFSNYYVVEKREIITFEKEILLRHLLKCLLPCELRMEDEKESYYFETGMYTLWMERMGELNPKQFFYEMFVRMEMIEGYLLNLDHLIIDEGHLFLDEENKPVFCYLPEYEKNIYEQIRQLLEYCMEHISYSEKKRVKFYYEFHGYLVKDKPNMQQIKAYLKSEPQSVPESEETEETEETVNMPPVMPKKDSRQETVKKIGMAAVFFFCLIGEGFFAVNIYMCGLYYKFVVGFFVFLGIMIGLIVFARKIPEKEREESLEEITEDETGTRFLDDDCTVLLTEQPVGTLLWEKEGKEIVINHSEFIIGSLEEGTDYCIPEVGVSRRHAKIGQKDGELFIQDLDSTNGVKVNGKKVKKSSLKAGDRITMGLEEFYVKTAGNDRENDL